MAAGRHPELVIARLEHPQGSALGNSRGYVFGFYVATQALAYASTYKTPAERLSLVHQFGANAGISAIVGPAREIQTVAGYTVWKCLTVLAIVGAVWGVLTATRLLRGEEGAGRSEILLAGQTTRRAGGPGRHRAGRGSGDALRAHRRIIIVVGRSSTVDIGPAGALYFALAIVAAPAMFLAVGALASQLAATRPASGRVCRHRARGELRAADGG